MFKVRTVHLELTERCNAACPMCGRNINGSDVLKSGITNATLSLADVQRIMPPAFLKTLDRILINGNYGDPLMAPDLIEICQYFRNMNSTIRIDVNTNGGAQSDKFWFDLASIVTRITFGIDGLEDTHHLYRKNTKFEKVIQHAKAALSAKHAELVWQMIIFKHNEHQIDACRQMATDLGFAHFKVRKTTRFHSTATTYKDKHPVFNEDGTKVEYFLEMPTEEQVVVLDGARVTESEETAQPIKWFQNVKNKEEHQLFDVEARRARRVAELGTSMDDKCITCSVQQSNEIYVSAKGYVTPCCWIGVDQFSSAVAAYENQKMMKDIGVTFDSINAFTTPIKEIIKGPFFSAIENSWTKPVADGRHLTCTTICSNRSPNKVMNQYEKL